MRRIFLLLLPLVIAGCAHNARKECAETDYYDMGFKDGKDGKDQGRLAEAKDRCGKENVPVAETKYNYGYKVGLTKFCDEGRGKSDAKKVEPNALCMSQAVPPYVNAYNQQLQDTRAAREKELAKVEEKKNKLQNRENEIHNDLNKIDQQKATAEPTGF